MNNGFKLVCDYTAVNQKKYVLLIKPILNFNEIGIKILGWIMVRYPLNFIETEWGNHIIVLLRHSLVQYLKEIW